MASRYKFSEEEIKAIEQRRKANKDKRAEARLKALELRAKGTSAQKAAEEAELLVPYLPQDKVITVCLFALSVNR